MILSLKKILPVIEYLQDIETLPFEEMWEITSLLTNAIQLPAMDKLLKESDAANKADEIITSFNKWVMPPQQQAYIKCRRYDFF